jgi:hypoxanthine phosphoribosyltransferase
MCVEPAPIVKLGCRRQARENGLLEIITRDELRGQVEAFGKWISHQYRGEKLTLVPVLHGATLFYADLTRHFDENGLSAIDRAIVAQSYGDGRSQDHGVTIHGEWINERHIEGRHCLVIDDILDQGNTSVAVTRWLEAYRPLSIDWCFLLRKQKKRSVALVPRFCLFEIDDCWVVGYGLDGNGGRYRHLRYIAELPECSAPGT